MPIILLLLGLGFVGFLALKTGLGSSSMKLSGPPYAVKHSDKGYYVATFATLTDAQTWLTQINQQDMGDFGLGGHLNDPTTAKANNNETEFIFPGVAAWVSWFPSASYTVSGPMLGVYFYVPPAALM
jgi:hypothetical protein